MGALRQRLMIDTHPGCVLQRRRKSEVAESLPQLPPPSAGLSTCLDPLVSGVVVTSRRHVRRS
jgi:hypothetical protein